MAIEKALPAQGLFYLNYLGLATSSYDQYLKIWPGVV